MSRLILPGLISLILLTGCEEPVTSEKIHETIHADYLGDIALPFNELSQSHSFSLEISDQQHLLISHLVNKTEQISYKEMLIDLKHQFETGSFLDFGYSAKLNENTLSRFHQSKAYNAFSFTKRETNLNAFRSIESENSIILFDANEGKMINDVSQRANNPKLIEITNITKFQGIEFNSEFSIKLNRPSSENNAFIGIELVSQAGAIERFIFKQSNSETEISFNPNDMQMLHERVSIISAISARIWILDECNFSSIQSEHKLTGNVYTTPMILKSVYGISVQVGI